MLSACFSLPIATHVTIIESVDSISRYDITSLETTLADDSDSGTESGEFINDRNYTDGSTLSSGDESDRSTQRGQNGCDQTVTANAPTTVVMNNISTTTILTGSGRKSVPSDIASGS